MDAYNELYGEAEGEWLFKANEPGGDKVDREQLDVADKVAQVSLEGATEGRSDRTFVKDKSAQLEAKLERENQKKLVSYQGY